MITTARKHLIKDIDSIVEEHSYYLNAEAEQAENLIKALCDAVCKHFPKEWWLPWGTSVLQCSLQRLLIHVTISIMFFQVASPESSNIAELYINPATLECIVEYKSGGTYSYTNVNAVAVDDLLYTRKPVSLGQWVNLHLSQNPGVICDNLDKVVRDIQREPIAAWKYFSPGNYYYCN